MKWEEIRKAFPEEWVLIEAIQAYTNEESERILEEVIPLKKFSNSSTAMKQLHQEDPKREMYVLHTSRKKLSIIEKMGGLRKHLYESWRGVLTNANFPVLSHTHQIVS